MPPTGGIFQRVRFCSGRGRLGLFVLDMLLQQMGQLTLEHVGIADVQLDQPLEVRDAVDVDVMTVEPQALFADVAGFYFHADFDIGSG